MGLLQGGERRLLGDQERDDEAPADGRYHAELLGRRDAQVSPPPLQRRRRARSEHARLQHGGTPTSHLGVEVAYPFSASRVISHLALAALRRSTRSPYASRNRLRSQLDRICGTWP